MDMTYSQAKVFEVIRANEGVILAQIIHECALKKNDALLAVKDLKDNGWIDFTIVNDRYVYAANILGEAKYQEWMQAPL